MGLLHALGCNNPMFLNVCAVDQRAHQEGIVSPLYWAYGFFFLDQDQTSIGPALLVVPVKLPNSNYTPTHTQQ